MTQDRILARHLALPAIPPPITTTSAVAFICSPPLHGRGVTFEGTTFPLNERSVRHAPAEFGTNDSTCSQRALETTSYRQSLAWRHALPAKFSRSTPFLFG